MSVQTGAESPEGPVSSRMVDRARYRFTLLSTDPNPIWIRELKQSVRLGRTPIVLMVVTILMTLLMASIGGGFSTSTAPADIGVALYHTFFSLAFFVVTWVGPAVAANSISSEREGRTWEALLLTGLPPEIIARGKFLAAYTAIGLYIVMLAPVGALAFMFGGVTAVEVFVAFVFLFLTALLSVAFGLAISSKMASLRVSIVVTLLLSVPLSLLIYSVLGVGLSFAAAEAWPGVEGGPPIWLPTAYERADFGISYLIFLVVLPTAATALPAWFLYEITISNLKSSSDDRSTGIKRWFVYSALILLVTGILPLFAVEPKAYAPVAVISGILWAGFLLFVTFVLTGEPFGPSRRVRLQADAHGLSKWKRFLGPGIISGSWLQLGIGNLGFLILPAVAFVMVLVADASGILTGPSLDEILMALVVFFGYGICFFIFTVGFAATMRMRSGTTPGVARVLLLAMVAAAAIVPWIIGVMTGAMDNPNDSWAAACASPFYTVRMAAEIDASTPDESVFVAGFSAAGGYALLGMLLLFNAQRRCKAEVDKYNESQAELQARYEAEAEAEREAAIAAMHGASPDAGASMETGEAGNDADAASADSPAPEETPTGEGADSPASEATDSAGEKANDPDVKA